MSARISQMADAIVDPIVSIVTLVAFAIIIPLIANVLGAITTTRTQITQMQNQLANVNLTGPSQATTPTGVFQGITPGGLIGYYAYDPATKSWKFQPSIHA